MLKDVPNFRGVYMRDTLPKKPHTTEYAVLNLDTHNNRGTHWVAYKKLGRTAFYFDPIGNLPPPTELVKYLKDVKIIYNTRRYQKLNNNDCGHLCVSFILNKNEYHI